MAQGQPGLLAGFLALMLLDLGQAGSPASPPNVLLIIADDLRSQLGDVPGIDDAGGLLAGTTPHLAALAANGTVFSRAYVQEALCAPSRNSFLSGRRPDVTKAWQFVDHFREGDGVKWTALPQLFKEQGHYTTVGVGKVYHKGLPPDWDLDYSWDERMANGQWDGWMYPSEPTCPNGTTWCAVPENTTESFDDEQTTAQAFALLRNASALRQSGGTPWFVAVGFRKPHLQWRFPERLLSRFPSDPSVVPTAKFPIFPKGAPDVAFHMPVDDFLEVFTDAQDCGAADFDVNFSFPERCQQLWRRAYWASVSFMDECAGKLVAEVERLGETDNTVVVFLGDHGWHLGEFGEWEKFTNLCVSPARSGVVAEDRSCDNGTHNSTP